MRNLFKNISGFLRKEYTVLAIFFTAAFLIRLYFIFVDTRPVDYDQLTYDKMALSILNNHEFSIYKGEPTAYVTPFYPIFLSIIYFLFGHSYVCVKMAQALLGSLTGVVIYFIAKEVFNRSVAVFALFFMAISYFFIMHGILLLSENLFIIFVAFSLLFLIRLYKKPSYINAVLFGLMCSFATLTRSAYFFFPFMAGAFIFLKRGFIGITRLRLLKLCAATLICFSLPIALWSVRNFIVFKTFVPLGTESGVVLYSAYNPPEGKIFESAVHDNITLKASKMPEVEYSRFLTRQAILAIKNDLSKIYKYIPLRIMYFFSVIDWTSFNVPGTYNFFSAFMLPLAFGGIILALRKRRSNFNLLLLLPIIYFILISVVITGVPRTRLPVEPYFIIFAAFFVNSIYKKKNFRLLATCVFGAWYFINYMFYLNSYSVKLIIKGFFQKMGLW